MAARPSPPKPHELRAGAVGGSGVSTAGTTRMTEFERARATGAPSAFSTTTTPTLPPRPGGGAYGGGSVLGSGGYGGGGYGASAYGGGGYGGGYGTSSSYGGGYGGYGASRYGGGYGTSSYGGGYGSGYGASRYGSRYGGGAGYGYGGAYGGYGGGYGGGGYSRGGALGAGPRGPGEGGPGVVTWIDQFSQVVDTFGRFAHLLDMNCDALYGSFSSVLRLFESMSELRRELLFIFQTVTLYRLLKSVLERFGSVGKFLTGTALHSTTTTAASSSTSTSLSSSAAGLDLDSFQQFQGKDRTAPRGRRLWPFLLFLVSAVGGPLLINRLWRMLRASAAAAAQQEQEQQPALQPLGERETPVLVQALYDFVGSGSEGDLQFNKGAVIRVVRADPDQGWWEGEMDGRVGLFPANFVQAVSRPSDSGSDVVGGAWRPVGSGLRDSEPIRLHLGADSPQPTRFT